ncbi:sugar phosphate isomerase/epimerase family protein [Runella slithyformis]|uniref:Xylose isomerase domain-containing protein TIM barrel n=1 Tax=Runella slithyformis (strain ATCC 29530 / DSM 19594 / LMG 11500 / NCIMB 11436 / LSU 4) TaxID=761193 RepID=A0A7U3ZQ36_RUNSL|nr:TIM barrel protein [Runella slithyformis]AEI51300.1 Xylose isomerase domain-containing protein TIM barrel [Runella slithyformis DSM 19594]
MKRRQFLQSTAMGFGALSLPEFPKGAASNRMGIVVHSYASRWNSKVESAKYPGFQNAVDLLEHCHQIGAGGMQVVVKDWSVDFAKKVRDRREKLGLYVEGSIGVPKKAEDVPAFENEVKNAREAGAQILRTVCSGGRRYEIFHSEQAFLDFKKSALVSLQLAEPILRKYKVKLAVENHKDWQANDLVAALKQLNSEWIGATLDFGNNIALMEDSAHVVQALAPYMFSTHIKDMAVEEYPDGFLLSEVPLGKGILDLPKLVGICQKHNPDITFSLEMITRDPLEIPCLKPDYWATFEDVSGREFAQALQMIRKNKSASPLPRVAQLRPEERLAIEESNIIESLKYSKEKLGLH